MKKFFIIIALLSGFAILSFFYLQFGIISSLNIKVNPYGFSPLTALIDIETKIPTSVFLRVKGKNGVADITKEFSDLTTKHSIPVLGLYLNQETDVILTVKNKNFSKEIPLKLKTNYKVRLPEIQIEKQTSEKNTYYFLDEGLIIDENGDVRFIFDKPKNRIKYYMNGEIITENRISGIMRFDLLGRNIRNYRYPKGFTSFTHGLGIKPNGNLFVIGGFSNKSLLYNGEWVPSHREFVIELDAITGEVVNKIDLAERLNPYRSEIVSAPCIDYGISDWCHINGVDYDATDDSIVISCRHFGMSKINLKTNKLKWLITPNIGLNISGRDGKSGDISNKVLTAVDWQGKPLPDDFQKGLKADKEFRWPTKNHHPSVIDGKYFSIFNNAGNVFNKKISSTTDANALIYYVDDKENTIKNIFQYQLNFPSSAAGAVTYIPEQNTVTIYIADAQRENDQRLTDGYIYVIDFSSYEILFKARIHRGGKNYFYKATPFSWYTDDALKVISDIHQDKETYLYFNHKHWNDFVSIKNDKLIRNNGDTARIISRTDNEITVKWDKYGTETFVKDNLGYSLKQNK